MRRPARSRAGGDRIGAACILALWTCGCAHPAAAAAPPAAGEVTGDEAASLEALKAELRRNAATLALKDAPPIHLLRYHVLRLNGVTAEASFGALRTWRDVSGRELGVELRVGAPAFDSSGFGGWETGTRLHPLAERPGVASDVGVAWLETDRAYKDAVEQFGRKTAVFTPPDDYPGDWQVIPPVRAVQPVAPPPDAARLTALVRSVAAAFAEVPGLETGQVEVGAEAGFHQVFDTAGFDVRRTREEVSLAAVAAARADDGMLMTDRAMWTVRRAEQLPGEEALRARARELAEGVAAAAAASTMDGEYVGPVVFEGEAAAELFRHLLVPQIEGTPPVVPFDTVIGEMGQGLLPDASGFARLGRRVLPLGWSVSDDPRRDPDHPAAFEYDEEGTPSRAVDVVTEGIVRTLLMGRIPRKGIEGGTNGHARGRAGDRLHGRASMTRVSPAQSTDRAGVRRAGLDLARSYGRDHILIVRRLVDPSLIPGEVPTGDEGGGLGLPPPLVAWRHYADGREVPVRGLSFAGVHRWVLRDIVAAGPQATLSYMAPFRPGSATFSPIHGMPTWISAPEVLVGEMELVPMSADPRERRAIPPPPSGPPAPSAPPAPSPPASVR